MLDLFFGLPFLMPLLLLTHCEQYTITHANDFNGIYKSTLSRTGHLVGGISRLYRYVQNDVFILAGNFLPKSVYSTPLRLYQDKKILKIIQPNVFVLGNNEFCMTPETYIMVMQYATPSISCADIELPLTKPAVIIPNSKIVIMGYSPIDSSKSHLVNMYNVKLKRTVSALKETINSLPKDHLFVAAGCAGISLATEIAKKVPNIAIVISGCEKVMQWNGGDPPDNILKNSSYPLVVKGVTGHKVLVAHTYGTTKFVGKLKVDIDDNGIISSYTGEMIYLNHTFPEDLPAIENILEKINTIELAKSRVFLNGNCTYQECNFGNLIADSFVDYKVNTHNGTDWTDTAIGIALSGTIKKSINATKTNEIILKDHVLYLFTPPTDLVTVKLLGKDIKTIFEQAIEESRDYQGIFLQVSGLYIRYDWRKQGKRRCTIYVRCSQCEVPSYRKIREENEYQVITTRDVLEGKFGHLHFSSVYKLVQEEVVTNFHALKAYLMLSKFINIGRQERIQITKGICPKNVKSIKLVLLMQIIINYLVLHST